MKRKYEKPTTEELRFAGLGLLQQISTKIGDGGATTGGRAPEMGFDAFNTSWDEEESSKTEA